MDNQMIPYAASQAVATPERGNYALTIAGQPLTLRRGTDFDNPIIKKTGKKAFDKPVLLKAGAEKIAFGCGLLQQYTVVSSTEDRDYFAYTVRCDLVKLSPSGERIVVSNSYGHANTAEARNGFKGAADAANGSLKMAQKRALVGAALAIAGLSDLFYQDIENDTFMEQASAITKSSPDDPITSKQITRIYALAGSLGLTTPEAKQVIIAAGYASTKDIRQKDYDSICDKIREAASARG